MPFFASNAVGGIIEGVLSLKNGAWTFVEDEDGDAIPLEEILRPWDGKRIRLNVADLEILDDLVAAGMTPGNEAVFLESLTAEQRSQLLGQPSPPPSGETP